MGDDAKGSILTAYINGGGNERGNVAKIFDIKLLLCYINKLIFYISVVVWLYLSSLHLDYLIWK